jgi:1,2-phenylacetyl-CoA epoxidase catalytic subunit
VQQAIDDYAPSLPQFFGGTGSKNNETYRKFALKERKNEEMREDFLGRARAAVESLGLRFPPITAA